MLDISQLSSSYFLVLTRLSAMLISAPIFSAKYVPQRYRFLLALALTFIITPLLGPQPPIEIFSAQGLFSVLQQVLVGLFMGLVLQIIFQVVVVAGQLIAMQSGLGFANLVDPSSGVSVPMVSQFYLMGTVILFLYTHGHLVLIKLLVNSFGDIGLVQINMDMVSLEKLVEFGSTMFSMAINLSLPAIVSLLIVSLTFAVMTRSSPQLNIFTIGFPVTLIIGLFVIYLNFMNVSSQTEHLFQDGFRFISHSLKVGGHGGP